MSSYTPPPPKVVDGWQPETEDQSQGFSSSSGGASFGIIMGGLIVLVIVLLVIVCLIFGRKQRLRDKRGNRKVQQHRPQERIPAANGSSVEFGQHRPQERIPAANGSSVKFRQHRSQERIPAANGSSVQHPPPSDHAMPKTFTYEELKEAANNFSEDKVLGRGGFGIVHKGVLRDGRIVAIKQQIAERQLGEREFLKEIEIISGIHHKHLVHLVGYCISETERLLVYEFVSNKSLSFHLHENDKENLDWKKRFNIAVGTAKGLVHLHDGSAGKPRIVHRDIKSANILLDEKWEAKVADFGLARSILADKTHISTKIAGTFGYMDPYFLTHGIKLNEKSDVYSFGMLLLELITGCRPLNKIKPSDPDGEELAVKANPMLREAVKDNNINVVYTDPKTGEFDKSEMFRMVHCAAACVCYPATGRPQMSQILEALEGKLDVKRLTERIKTTFTAERISWDKNKLLEMLKAITEEDPASSIG
ncbi:proline-rich receptor-like protein kinase PERK1 [Pistacia vera]|uniref:proline-rich receptor-like protein kinase PERK1 n=1 Tax=Pistacia vera TaxID=55513 RepID=UPI0012639768|nr:proline-rich receptor-like protein kinase PERK1 [Pistacia vera]